ncbi:MAG TPA: hypothetical protein VK524_24590 [Polyangiaceae bacterium]|nr:hypothetical protein [Polyangiaceae bacterium]
MMSDATQPHFEGVPAVPVTGERRLVRRGRFTLLDEYGRSPDDPPSSLPRMLAAVAGMGAAVLVAAYAVRAIAGPDLGGTSAGPVKPVFTAVSEQSRAHALWIRAQTDLKVPAPETKPEGAGKALEPAKVEVKTAARLQSATPVAPLKRREPASDNPYAEPAFVRSAPSDNPY